MSDKLQAVKLALDHLDMSGEALAMLKTAAHVLDLSYIHDNRERIENRIIEKNPTLTVYLDQALEAQRLLEDFVFPDGEVNAENLAALSALTTVELCSLVHQSVDYGDNKMVMLRTEQHTILFG